MLLMLVFLLSTLPNGKFGMYKTCSLYLTYVFNLSHYKHFNILYTLKHISKQQAFSAYGTYSTNIVRI